MMGGKPLLASYTISTYDWWSWAHIIITAYSIFPAKFLSLPNCCPNQPLTFSDLHFVSWQFLTTPQRHNADLTTAQMPGRLHRTAPGRHQEAPATAWRCWLLVEPSPLKTYEFVKWDDDYSHIYIYKYTYIYIYVYIHTWKICKSHVLNHHQYDLRMVFTFHLWWGMIVLPVLPH